MSESKFEIGLNFVTAPSVRNIINRVNESKFDFCCIPLVHPRFRRDLLKNQTPHQFARPDITLHPNDWARFIYGTLSEGINVDVAEPIIQRSNEIDFDHEIEWAMYLCVRGVIFTLPSSGSMINLARIMNRYSNNRNIEFIIKIPLISPLQKSYTYRKDYAEVDINESPWNRWHTFRCLVNPHVKLTIALNVECNLPPSEELHRWQGEPVKFLILPKDIFVLNKKGFPILAAAHRCFVESMIRRVNIIMSGKGCPVKMEVFSDYLYLMWQKCTELPLNGPALQTLIMNLELQTYEDFENDIVKYAKYREAISRAIIKKQESGGNTGGTLVLMILRAGKGPMLNIALDVASQSKIQVKVYAIDDHPEAFMSLQTYCPAVRDGTVEVVECDARNWNAPEKADILISDLLGSFGDNEMCPEYLNAMQRNLKSDGIIIPNSYTSYICPVHCFSKFNLYDSNKELQNRLFVANLSDVYIIDNPQELFTFTHPTQDFDMSNVWKSLRFEIKTDCVLHGFYGFFKTVLYDNITLSTVIKEQPDDLCSWFPVFIPNHTPIYLKQDSILKLNILRNVSQKEGLRYGWYLNKPTHTTIRYFKGCPDFYDIPLS